MTGPHAVFLLIAAVALLCGSIVCLGFPKAVQAYAIWCVRMNPKWMLRDLQLRYVSSKSYRIVVRLTGVMTLFLAGAFLFASIQALLGH